MSKRSLLMMLAVSIFAGPACFILADGTLHSKLILITDVDGAALYNSKCAKCHGAEGKGTPKYLKQGQKDFTDSAWQRSRTDAQLNRSISEGQGDFMPAWKQKLSIDEIKALVGQIRAFGKKK